MARLALMEIREISDDKKDIYNPAVNHPVQSWEWGEFRKRSGLKVLRFGIFDKKKLISAYQLIIHPLPRLPFSVIYFPKGPKPTKLMLMSLKKIGQREKAIFIKLEPNVIKDDKTEKFCLEGGLKKGKSFFAPHTFLIDLKQSEEQLMKNMKSKTRYNIKVANRHKVKIVEDNSPIAFKKYLRLTTETTRRQGFYAHTPRYHRLMWQALNSAGIAHLFLAKLQKKILATWILFTFNNVLYYPYGASIREHQETMPAYALAWEAMKWGKSKGCQSFDLWGCLGPNPNPKDPWFGFHRFKEGFGGKLVEFTGTYDLVINPWLYRFYNLADFVRWQFLRLKPRSKHD